MKGIKGALNTYIQTRRGVGHTTLMKEGVKNYDKPFFVLGANKKHALELMTGVDNNNAIPLGLNGLDNNNNNNKLDGVNHPMIIDAFTVQIICEEYEDKIIALKIEQAIESSDLRKEINERDKLNNRLSVRIRDVRDELKFFRMNYEKLRSYTVLVNKKVKNKFLRMGLFNRIFRYNKALDKLETRDE